MLNHEPLRLADGEYRFACLVWDNEPLPSGQLVALAAEGLGWKKSTTYTVLKKLCERGVLQNADGRVTSLIKKEDVQQSRVPIKQYLQKFPQWGRFGVTSVTPFLLLPVHSEGYTPAHHT